MSSLKTMFWRRKDKMVIKQYFEMVQMSKNYFLLKLNKQNQPWGALEASEGKKTDLGSPRFLNFKNVQNTPHPEFLRRFQICTSKCATSNIFHCATKKLCKIKPRPESISRAKCKLAAALPNWTTLLRWNVKKHQSFLNQWCVALT